MASCPKCGKRRLRKDAEKRRFCRHCGLLRSPANMCRSGHVILQDDPVDNPAIEIPRGFQCEAAS